MGDTRSLDYSSCRFVASDRLQGIRCAAVTSEVVLHLFVLPNLAPFETATRALPLLKMRPPKVRVAYPRLLNLWISSTRQERLWSLTHAADAVGNLPQTCCHLALLSGSLRCAILFGQAPSKARKLRLEFSDSFSQLTSLQAAKHAPIVLILHVLFRCSHWFSLLVYRPYRERPWQRISVRDSSCVVCV